MQRYQRKSYDSIFSRWANHVNEWVENSKKFKNIYLVKYKDLDNNYNSTMENLLKIIDLKNLKLIRPPKKNYVMTNQMNIHDSQLKKYKDFIKLCLSEYPFLEKLIES